MRYPNILNTGFGHRFGEILGSSPIKDALRLKKGGGRDIFRHALCPDLKRSGRFAFWGLTLPRAAYFLHKYPLASANRHAYMVPATGAVEIDGRRANARDGVAISEGVIRITAVEDAEIVLVDTR